MNKSSCRLIILSLLACGTAQAQLNTTYLCSLKISSAVQSRVWSGMNRVLVDIKDQEVQLSNELSADSKDIALSEAFPGSEKVIRAATGKGHHYLIKAYWKTLGSHLPK